MAMNTKCGINSVYHPKKPVIAELSDIVNYRTLPDTSCSMCATPGWIFQFFPGGHELGIFRWPPQIFELPLSYVSLFFKKKVTNRSKGVFFNHFILDKQVAASIKIRHSMLFMNSEIPGMETGNIHSRKSNVKRWFTGCFEPPWSHGCSEAIY